MQLWIILKSLDPIKTAKFYYETLGITWQTTTIENGEWLVADKSPLPIAISLKSEVISSSNLLFVDPNLNNMELHGKTDPDGRIIHILAKQWNNITTNIEAAKNFIIVLRCLDIENTKRFYNNLGTWQQEKHGSGPVHYYLAQKLGAMEIYPKRPQHDSNIEFLISIDPTLKQYDKNVTYTDPDNRIVRFY